MSDALQPCPFCKSRMEVIDGTYVGHTHGGVWCPIQTNLFDVKGWSMLGADLASPLSAAAMKRAAAKVASGMTGIASRDRPAAILALPSPTPAQMLAEAREMPQIKALETALREIKRQFSGIPNGHQAEVLASAALVAWEAGE